jgi:dihydrofolate reductase
MNRIPKLIVHAATSADRFIARKDGSVDWLEHYKGGYGMRRFYATIDACVMGRKTYELAVRFGMPDGYAGKKNYVFSRTLAKAASPKISIVNDDVSAFAKRLRAENEKDIWLVGGAELIAGFLDAAQVDEFIVHLMPRLIGEGIPLIAPRHRDAPLKLLATRKFADGVVMLHYAVEPS